MRSTLVYRTAKLIGNLSRCLLPSLALGVALTAAAAPAAAAPAGAEGAPSQEKAGACVANATTLCLNDNRFAVTASWRTRDRRSGAAKAVALTADTGYFWFFSSSNVEAVVKVLDGCGLNRRFWVFAGGLTDVQVDLSVRDTATGQVKTYRNPQGTVFRPIQDTDAFTGCRGTRTPSAVAAAAGTPTGTALPLNRDRFQVTATWRTPDGRTGAGQAVRLTDETGYFWFFSPANVELIVKLLDGCPINQGFWLFSGGLTNVEVQIRVTDTVTGFSKTYHSAPGTPFQPVADTGVFYCSTSGLPPDPGAAGRSTLAGVDSDRDGLRDDLQRYIVIGYGTSPETVGALRQSAKALQRALLDSGSPASAADRATELARASECLRSLRPGDAREVRDALVAQALDTETRGLAYLTFNDRLGGTAFPASPPGGWRASCDPSVTAADPGARSRALAATLGATCNQNSNATVFFGNGMLNTCDQAQESTAELAAGVLALLPEEERSRVGFATACNPTRGVLADLWRAYKQSVSSSFTSFFRGLAGIDLLPDSFQRLLADKAAQLTEAAAVDDPTLADHIQLYRSLLFEGQRVIVTAHSQGNFYANLAQGALAPEDQSSFGIVSVGNPDSRVAGGFAWTTFNNDVVINAIRPVTGALPGNVGFHLDLLRDWKSHEFLGSYMATRSTRNRILNQVHEELETLPPPSNQAGNGVITLTLTWDHATDVDLHVIEPDGTHVFYANLAGVSGFLDFDDVSGFGPEHYFVACDGLVPGVYRVGVNYYSGDVPETAHVQIAAGLLARSFSVNLPEARGPVGNDSPVPVADIVVTGSAETGYSFEVRPLS